MSFKSLLRGAPVTAAAAALTLASSTSAATAADATWAGGASAQQWSNAGMDGADWSGGAVPGSPLGTLSFPDLPGCDTGAPLLSCYTSVNDLGPVSVGRLSFGGGKEYQIYPATPGLPGDAITVEGNHPGAPRARNIGLVARPIGANLQLANVTIPLVVDHDQTWEVRHYGILYLNSVSGAHALGLALHDGWVQADDITTGPLTISGPGELQLNQPAGGTATLPKVTVNDSIGKAAGLGISATNATSGSIHITGTNNKFIVLTDKGPGETLLHVNGNVTLDPTTTTEFEIDGNDTSPGNESSQLTTQGVVDFRGAHISLWQEQNNGSCQTLTPGTRYTVVQGGTLGGPIKVGGKLISPGQSASERFRTNSCAVASQTTAILKYRRHSLTVTIGRRRGRPPQGPPS